jgi:methylenetetrahydrofolate dehydrogenase (NADP+)/methenyltetrahydrofolate cyclohydrolase
VRILDSEALQAQLEEKHRDQISSLEWPPRLDIYLGADPHTGAVDPPSEKYVGMKVDYGASVGVDVRPHRVQPRNVLGLIAEHGRHDDTDGIVVQHPLPGIDNETAFSWYDTIPSRHDVDGLSRSSRHVAATPKGMLALVDHYEIPLFGRNVVLIGKNSRMIGEPLYPMLLERGAVVHAIDKKLGNADQLPEIVNEADVIFSCAGVPGLVKTEYLRKGQVIIDASTRIVEVNGKKCQVGDLELSAFESPVDFWANRAKGVIGPLTVRSLIGSTIDSAEMRDDEEQVA